MKLLKYKFLFLVGITVIFSCKKDFLNETGETRFLYRENYVKNLSGMNEFLNGIYLEFNAYWSGIAYYAYADYLADNVKLNQNPLEDLNAKYKWGQVAGTIDKPTFANMTVDWQNNYKVIRGASFIIEDVDKYRAENPTKADYIKGQALVFRAIMHFKLVNVFAQSYSFTPEASHPGVPYIITSDPSETYTRQTVKQVYDAIVSDLKEGIELMKNHVTSDIRYLNQDAAKAILSRVYLFKGDYTNSLLLAKDVCDRHPLMSIAQGFPNGLYNNKPFTETEVLFQVSPADFPATTYVTTNFVGRYFKGSPSRFLATNDIADVLSENNSDIRSTWITKTGDNWMVSKFPSGIAGIRTNKDADYYEPLIRSSELFLNVAEASAKTGDEVSARLYLNQLRKRANPAAIDISLSGGDLLNAIYKERRKELCFENFRLFDLMRLKMGVNRTDVYDNAPTRLPYGSDHAISPIPKKEIDIMGLAQNPGY